MTRARMLPFVASAALAAGVATALVPLPASALTFRFPVQDPALIWADMILHVDHDPADLGQGDVFCTASNCSQDFPNCYDQHRGTDFILDGGFGTMDKEIARVVAAAGGTVIEAVDGNYDRCHADMQTQQVTCDGNPIQANYVALRHGDGTVTLYYHLKKGSVAVQVGQVVACGDTLGLVGSSGISSMPHLHFQVEDPSGAILDPYPGACGAALEWWVVEDAGNGLPGPWCEGQTIPPEPVPEAGVEAVPDPAPEVGPEFAGEPTPEVVGDDAQDPPLADDGPDASPADESTVPAEAGTGDVPGEGGVADMAAAEDPGAADASGRADTEGARPAGGGFGCAAGARGPVAAGSRAAVPAVLSLALLACGFVRRRGLGQSRVPL